MILIAAPPKIEYINVVYTKWSGISRGGPTEIIPAGGERGKENQSRLEICLSVKLFIPDLPERFLKSFAESGKIKKNRPVQSYFGGRTVDIIIAQRLKELRVQKGNTQEDLADFLSISIPSVSKWERGVSHS